MSFGAVLWHDLGQLFRRDVFLSDERVGNVRGLAKGFDALMLMMALNYTLSQ